MPPVLCCVRSWPRLGNRGPDSKALGTPPVLMPTPAEALGALPPGGALASNAASLAASGDMGWAVTLNKAWTGDRAALPSAVRGTTRVSSVLLVTRVEPMGRLGTPGTTLVAASGFTRCRSAARLCFLRPTTAMAATRPPTQQTMTTAPAAGGMPSRVEEEEEEVEVGGAAVVGTHTPMLTSLRTHEAVVGSRTKPRAHESHASPAYPMDVKQEQVPEDGPDPVVGMRHTPALLHMVPPPRVARGQLGTGKEQSAGQGLPPLVPGRSPVSHT